MKYSWARLFSIFFLFFLARIALGQSLKDLFHAELKAIKGQSACRKETIVELEKLFNLMLSGFFTPNEAIEDEPNDSLLFANRMTLEGKGKGTIQKSDTDFWKVFVPENGKLGVAMTAEATGIKLYLYRYGSKRAIGKSEKPFRSVQEVSESVKKGLYFVQIKATFSKKVPYTVKITFLPASLK